MSEAQVGSASPRVFISYSWDDEPHKQWVRGLAAQLRSDGIEVMLDQWEVQPGDRLPAFMEAAVRDNDFVLIVCTPHYKDRSDARQGGVGYEGDIMTGELRGTRNERKFIPLLRRGDETTAVPSWLAGKYFIDLREDADLERSCDDLLTTLFGRREAPPPLGIPPHAAASQSASGRVESTDSFEPIRILGVIADEVSEPLHDGTRGSALYRIPLRLSRRPSAEWAELFESTWDNPPRFTTMHRPGIVSVRGDRIVLDGTTLEELEGYHRDTLVLVLEKVNHDITEREVAERGRAEAESRRREEHRRHVEDMAGRLSFGDDVPSSPDRSQAPTSAEPTGARRWSIEGAAATVPPQGRDATGFAWKLRCGDVTRSIVVWISGSAMASTDSGLPSEVVQAKRTKGRSVLGDLLGLDSPPGEVLVSSHGAQWKSLDASGGDGTASPEEGEPHEPLAPEGDHRGGSRTRDALRLELLKELRDLVLESKDAAREAVDRGDQVTSRLINGERRIKTVMKQLGDQDFPLDLTNFANQAQNAHWTMSMWQAADAAVEKMIVESTRRFG